MPTKEQILAGQAVYTRRTLRLYDFFVLGVSNRFVWRCPSQQLLSHYGQHISMNHLDVGVGTGYFLDKSCLPAQSRISLMDLNATALAFAGQRIARYAPAQHLANVLEPICLEVGKFDSIGLGYLLHCLPGTITSKAVAFDHLKRLMNPGASIFGATLLHKGVSCSAIARHLMAFYNRKGIFCNRFDDLDGLKRALRERFNDVDVKVVGCAAMFHARI